MKSLKILTITLIVALAAMTAAAQERNVENSEFMNKVAQTAWPYEVIYVGDFFDAEAITGFNIGAIGGWTRDGWEAGISLGYSGLYWQCNISTTYGRGVFEDRTYLAPSAFADFQGAIVRFGKNKTWGLYAGGKIGYKHAEKMIPIHYEDEEIKIDGQAESFGSGLAGGPVISLEKRWFHNPMRVYVEGGYVWHDMQIKGEKHVRGLWEIKVGVKFTFHKKMRNY